ncbi:MAG: hypothetical protein HY298_23050 [Verrucomicrobia bacterium]|nr:hypothetical protein [Verrucomicrobiota bacterium]
MKYPRCAFIRLTSLTVQQRVFETLAVLLHPKEDWTRKTNTILCITGLLFSALSPHFSTAFAQGTTITYQGRLDAGGSAFSGNAEFQPTLWDALSGGSQLGTNNPLSVIVAVTNGLFVLPLDFGDGPFNAGADRWLQLQVRTSIGPFTTLTPRQPLTSAPYAIHSANAATAGVAASANSVAAANITGTLGLAQLPSALVTNNETGVNLTGAFSGNGGALSNLSASALVAPLTGVSITTWGDTQFGQREVPANLDNVVAVAPGIAHSLALRADGTVAAWGAGATNNPSAGVDFGQSIIPPGLNNAKAVAAGYLHSLALKSNGTVVAWGWNDYGQTNVPVTLSNVTAVSAGAYHTLALKTDGTLVGWGTNSNGQLSIPPGLSNVMAVSAGLLHSLVLKSNGTVVAWGAGQTNDPGTGQDFGQSLVPPGLSNVVAIAAGGVHSLALKADGTVVAWGAGQTNDPGSSVDYGQSLVPPGLSNVVAVVAGVYHSLVLKSDGMVVGWGGSGLGEADVPPGLNNVFMLGAGSCARHALALRRRAESPVAWLDSDNTFNGSLQINGEIHAFGEATFGGDLRLDDGNLWFRGGLDRNNGLGWYGTNKSFGDFSSPAPDGPILFGYAGGGLGTTTNGSHVVLSWDASQRVGIGTVTPNARLSLGGDQAASKLLLYDSYGSEAGLGFTGFQFRLHLPDTSSRFAFLDAPNGNEVFTIQGGTFGNVGIGTNSPQSKLHVRGDIRLGSSGQYFAPGGQENLRIIRGVVNAAGTILAGQGFTVTKGPTGFFTVTFSPAFSDMPAVTVTAQSGIDRMATCTSVSTSSTGIWTRDSAGTATDNQFNFIAIGPR